MSCIEGEHLNLSLLSVCVNFRWNSKNLVQMLHRFWKISGNSWSFYSLKTCWIMYTINVLVVPRPLTSVLDWIRLWVHIPELKRLPSCWGKKKNKNGGTLATWDYKWENVWLLCEVIVQKVAKKGFLTLKLLTTRLVSWYDLSIFVYGVAF